MLPLHEDVVHTVCAMWYDWQVCCAGYIKLWLPVFHIGYWKPMMSTLQCICKSCSSILLPAEEFRIYLKRMRYASIHPAHPCSTGSPYARTDKVLQKGGQSAADKYRSRMEDLKHFRSRCKDFCSCGMLPSVAETACDPCRSPKLERIQRMRLFKVIADRCKRTRACFCCGTVNGPVK